MLFGVYFLLLAGTGIGRYPPLCIARLCGPVVDRYFLAAPNPDKLTLSTTDIPAIRLGHAAANTGPPVGPAAQPRMRHLCKNMQKAVQNTATRLLTIIGISGPSLSNTAPIPEGRLSRIHFTYHNIISVPVIHPAVALEAGDFQGGPQPDGTVMRHHEVHNFHKDGSLKGTFLHRVHRALMSLGPWEGRIVAFVLGAISVLSAEPIRRSVLTTFADGRLRDWCSSPHGLGLGRVARPRRPRHTRARGSDLPVRGGGCPSLHGHRREEDYQRRRELRPVKRPVVDVQGFCFYPPF